MLCAITWWQGKGAAKAAGILARSLSATKKKRGKRAGKGGGGSSGDWVSHTDKKGRKYYYNNRTKETKWTKPDGFSEAPKTPAGGGKYGGHGWSQHTARRTFHRSYVRMFMLHVTAHTQWMN